MKRKAPWRWLHQFMKVPPGPQAAGRAMAADGLTTIPSSYGPEDTMNRLEAAVAAKGMTVFARIDHAAGESGWAVAAADRGLDLLPKPGHS